MVGGKRLLAEHVEHGGGKLPAIQQGLQVFLHQMPTARYVDQQRTGLQLRQSGAVQNVLGLGSQRQHVDQHPGSLQKGREAFRTAEAFHTRNLLGTAAPTPHGEAEYPDGPRDTLTQCAQAHHAHRELRTRQRLAVGPLALRHVLVVGGERAEMPDQRVAHVFSHLVGHARIIKPYHQRVR